MQSLPASAEDGSWTPGWAACDQSGNPLTGSESPYFPWGSSVYNLTGVPAGSASGYEALASYALSQPYWGLFDAYFPNRRPDDLSSSWYYGAPPSLTAGLVVQAKAQNNAQIGYNYVFSYGSDSQPITSNVQAQAQSSLTGTYKWDPIWDGWDDNGDEHYYDPLRPDPNDPFKPKEPEPSAPDHLNLLVSTSVTVSAGLNWNRNMGNPQAPIPSGWSATASATLGQDSVSAPGQVTSQSLTAKRLMQVGTSGGTATITLPAQAQATANNTVPAPFLGGGQADVSSYASMGASAVIDDRAVTISCPDVDDGGSYYKEPAITGTVIENFREPDGTMRGDTVNDLAGTNLTYTGTAAGYWSPTGTTYHWFSSIIQGGSSGDYPSIGDFPLFYSYAATRGQTDHVFLSMYDGSDGAEATNNYYMHFHDQWEPSSWPADAGTYHVSTTPDSEVPSWPTYPWQVLEDQQPLYGPMDSGTDITVSRAGFKDVDGGLDLGKDPVVAHFGFSYQTTDEINQTKTITPTPPLPSGFMTWVVYRENVNRTKGHLDEYGVHGYCGFGAWRQDTQMGWDTFLYAYQPTGTPVTAPPTGWNPPGY